MQALGQILQSLGIDVSLLYQLALCMLLYWVLARYVFGAFFAAHQKREHQTVGNEDVVAGLRQKYEQAADQYQQLARDLNHQSQQIVHTRQQKAQQECARILSQAKNKAHNRLEQGQQQLNQQEQAVKKQLTTESEGLAHSIVQKLTKPV